jgi:hypothetical protein
MAANWGLIQFLCLDRPGAFRARHRSFAIALRGRGFLLNRFRELAFYVLPSWQSLLDLVFYLPLKRKSNSWSMNICAFAQYFSQPLAVLGNKNAKVPYLITDTRGHDRPDAWE